MANEFKLSYTGAEINKKLGKIDELEKNSKVLTSRMDTFASLEEGSTTGDAELVDIRVGVDGTIYSTAGEAVREQVSKLSEEIDYKREKLIEINNGAYLVGFNGTFILCEHPVTRTFESITFQTLKTGVYDIDISFWSYDGMHFHRLKTENFTGDIVNGEITIHPNYYSADIYYIGFYSANDIYGYPTSGGADVICATNERDVNTLIKMGNVSAYLPNCEIIMTKSSIIKNNIEVHVGKGCKYSQIQQALDDNENADYLTIYLHPSDIPYNRFSTMRKLSDDYPWNGIMCKHISIIGLDKEKCIVQDDSGNYETPTAEISVNGVVENIRFIATHEKSTEDFTNASYALHVDNRPFDVNGYHLIFKNCDFISYQAPAVGLGVYVNQHIEFIDCNIVTDADRNYQPNPDYRLDFANIGAYFMHTSMNYAEGNGFITFRNCKIISVHGDYSMYIENSDRAEGFTIDAVNNTCWAGGVNSTGVRMVGVTTLMKSYNHGNNAETLNAI